MKRQDFVRGSVLLTAVAMTTLIASTSTHPLNDSPSGVPTGTAGLWAHIDSETGDLQVGPAPSAALALDADLQNAVRRDTEGLTLVRHANGAVSMNLQGRYQSVSTIRIDENGVAAICTDNSAGVESALKGQPSTTPEVQ